MLGRNNCIVFGILSTGLYRAERSSAGGAQFNWNGITFADGRRDWEASLLARRRILLFAWMWPFCQCELHNKSACQRSKNVFCIFVKHLAYAKGIGILGTAWCDFDEFFGVFRCFLYHSALYSQIPPLRSKEVIILPNKVILISSWYFAWIADEI